jgi:membrane-associated phospholipid phosphatase
VRPAAPRLARWLVLTSLTVAVPLEAQTPPTPPEPIQVPPQSEANPERPAWKLLRDILRDFRHLPSRDTFLWLGVGGGAALAGHPLDDRLNRRLVGSGFWEGFFDPGKVIGYGAVQTGAAMATYIVGRAKRYPRVAHLGVDLLRAQALTQALTYGLKAAVRRPRPDGSGGYAFPSGHASVTFASATVLQRHLGWKAMVPAYLVAAYVGTSRMHEHRHFLTDVLFGASLGIAAGRTVTRHGRNAWAVVPTVDPGRVAVLVVRRPRTSE